MRSIGNVRLTMGLVSCSVQMMATTACHDRKASMFHRHEDGTYASVKMPKTCEGCGEKIAQGDIVNGYEENGEMVMLTADDLETLKGNTEGALAIPQFIRADEVNPMMFIGEKAYYLCPDVDPKRGGKQALAIYLTIRHHLIEKGLVGVVQYTKWGRNRTALLRVEPTSYGGVLVIQNMMWPDELREPDFPVLAKAGEADIDPRLLPVGGSVIDSMVEDWNPDNYRDTYMEQLNAAIAAGKVVETSTDESAPAPDDISDLLAKLEASTKKAPAKKATPRKKAAA
jgi:DNA end-binding protein Ku